jgi:hypothetical protein
MRIALLREQARVWEEAARIARDSIAGRRGEHARR